MTQAVHLLNVFFAYSGKGYFIYDILRTDSLQGFELYGREIQLGWGQDNEGEEKQHLVQNSTFMVCE